MHGLCIDQQILDYSLKSYPDEDGLYLEWGYVQRVYKEDRCMRDRMQHIFGLLAIHTTPIGHRVSETGDNSVSVLYTRDGTCVQQ